MVVFDAFGEEKLDVAVGWEISCSKFAIMLVRRI